MEGRYGLYVSDGETHATLPKDADPKAVTLEEGVALIDARAAKGPARRRRAAGPAPDGSEEIFSARQERLSPSSR